MSVYRNHHAPSVLVVNDAREMLELVKASLAREGYAVLTAVNGRQALEIAQTVALDAIVSDVVMPEMDGIELCARLKENPDTAQIPVLLFSAVRTSELDALRGLNAGADDYLEIPFRQQELLIKIARLIERARLKNYYRQIVELSSDAIYTLDKNRRLISINEAGQRLFGRGENDLREQTEIELLAPRVADWETLDHARILNDSCATLNVRNQQGELRAVELRRKPFFDNTGNLTGFHCILQDFTERFAAERQAREDEQRYRSLYQDSPLMYFVLDERGTVLSVNQTAVDKLGYAEAELVGTLVFDVFVPEDRAQVLEQIELLKNSASQVAQWEFRKIHKSGGIVHVSENVRMLPQSDGGSIFLVICEDITERKLAQIALEQSQQQFQTIAKNAAVVFVMFDENGILRMSEGAALAKLNRRPGELVGRSIEEIWAKYPNLLAHARRALAGETFSATEQLEDVFFEANFSPLYDANNALRGIVGIATEITERVRAEQTAAQLIARLNETVEREELINRITNHVRQELRSETVFKIAVGELGTHLAVDRAVLYVFDSETSEAQPRAAFSGADVRDEPLEFHQLPLGEIAPLFENLTETGLFAFDAVTASSLGEKIYENVIKPRGIRALMCVAIKSDGAIAGFIAFSMHREARRWSETDIALARAVAAQVGIVIRQAQLYAEVEAASQREALINRLSTAIRSSLRLSEVHQTATHELGKALDASRVYLRLFDSQQINQDAIAEYVYAAPNLDAPPPLPAKYTEPIGREILEHRRTIVINNTGDLPTHSESIKQFVAARIASRAVRSAVYCPILVDGKHRGTLCIEQNDRIRNWTDGDLALIEAVAAQLALGAAHAELFELTRRAKQEWQATFDAMGDGVFIFDRAGKLVRVNRAGAALEHSTPATLLGKSCCELLLGDGENDNQCVVRQVIETGTKYTNEQQSKLLRRPLLITDEPIFDHDNRLIGVVCTVRDLHELRRAEAVARERQSLLTGILAGILEPIFAVDQNGKLLWCNRATADVYGIRASEIERRSFEEMVHPADRETSRAALRASLDKLPQFYETRFINGAGEVRSAVFNSVPLVIENELSSVLWFVRDTTQQKLVVRQAQQAEKLRALGQLASGVAHDFNNGLAAILGRVNILERQSSDHAVLRNLKIIKTAAEDAAATVRRIQTFAKQSANSDFAPVEIVSLLRDSLEITRTRWEDLARTQRIEYAIDLHADKSFYVYGSASELREVFVNLIVNALDAMPHGGKLEIRCERRDNTINLTFADEGEGISEDARERIFEPFFSTKGVNGTGLGLSVSYGIVEQHRGSIEVVSQPRRGTVFAVSLPASDVHQKQAVPVMLQQPRKNLSILVVDDEELVREALMEMIEEFATEVAGATSADDALCKLAAQRFDVVFTDFSMPEMDGLQLAEKIHQNWSWVKTVLVTGYGKGVTIPPEKRQTLHAVIGKPFNFEQLSQTFEEITA